MPSSLLNASMCLAPQLAGQQRNPMQFIVSNPAALCRLCQHQQPTVAAAEASDGSVMQPESHTTGAYSEEAAGGDAGTAAADSGGAVAAAAQPDAAAAAQSAAGPAAAGAPAVAGAAAATDEATSAAVAPRGAPTAPTAPLSPLELLELQQQAGGAAVATADAAGGLSDHRAGEAGARRAAPQPGGQPLSGCRQGGAPFQLAIGAANRPLVDALEATGWLSDRRAGEAGASRTAPQPGGQPPSGGQQQGTSFREMMEVSSRRLQDAFMAGGRRRELDQQDAPASAQQGHSQDGSQAAGRAGSLGIGEPAGAAAGAPADLAPIRTRATAGSTGGDGASPLPNSEAVAPRREQASS